MKKLFILLIFSILACRLAKAADCVSLMRPVKIEFFTSYGKLNYDFFKTQNEVTAIARSTGILERGLFASGLATIQVAWEINVNTISEIVSEGEICVLPTSIEIFIGYQNPTIYIAKNITPGSCQYNVVLRHEQTHHQINKTALDHFLPHFYKAAAQTADRISPKQVSSIEEIDKATQLLSREYTEKIAPAISFFKQQLLTEQGKLDNKSNYIHEAGLCRE